jgi:pSer/pThr/pTyr-binding forkhead associated (FHA) protein
MIGTLILALRILLALALYGFLGWALFFLWKEIQRETMALSTRRIPGISLTREYGTDHHTTKYFSQPEITLGRDPTCDLPCEDAAVSTRHAHLSYHHKQWWVTDLASTNGTYLNGVKVTMPTVVTSGDILQCGNIRVRIHLTGDILVSPTEKLERAK